MSRSAKIVVVSLSLLVFSYVGFGYVLGKTDDDKAYRSLTVYGEVLQRVQEDYVDEPNMSVVTAGRPARPARIPRSLLRLSEPPRILRL